jgi:hypothetical protein
MCIYTGDQFPGLRLRFSLFLKKHKLCIVMSHVCPPPYPLTDFREIRYKRQASPLCFVISLPSIRTGVAQWYSAGIRAG